MAITLGQHTRSQGNDTTPGINTQTSGSSFIVVVAAENTAVTSITDNKGNTYTALGSAWSDVINGFNFRGRAFICLNGAGGTGHTFTQSGGGFPTVIAAEIKSTSALSIENQDWATGVSVSSTPKSLGSVSASSGSIVIGAFAGTSISGDSVFSYSNSFTAIEEEGSISFWGGGLCHLITSSASTYGTTVSTSQTASFAGGIISLKESSAGITTYWYKA